MLGASTRTKDYYLGKMDEAQLQQLMERVRHRFSIDQNFTPDMKSSHIARRAVNLFDDLDDDMRELRIYGRTNPSVLKLCEELALYFLKCGEICFDDNKNDTSLNDKMIGLANRSVLGLEHSLQSRFDDDYQRNHWHGW